MRMRVTVTVQGRGTLPASSRNIEGSWGRRETPAKGLGMAFTVIVTTLVDMALYQGPPDRIELEHISLKYK